MKAVLISIRPKWVELIASGKKTIEIRKTRPKLETPFKCYIYQSGKNLTSTVYGSEFSKSGYIVGEFVCDRMERVDVPFPAYMDQVNTQQLKEACLSYREAHSYLGHGSGYGWHISALKMYDEPKELSEFEKACDHENDCCTCKRFSVNYACINSISRPPQSYMYVEELADV